MKRSLLIPCSLLLAGPLVAAGPFALKSSGTANQIFYRGEPLVESIVSKVLPEGDFTPDTQTSLAPLADGGWVSNLWSETADCRFRQEVAVHPGGRTVEITFMTENAAHQGFPGKQLDVVIPYSLVEGATYQAYATNSRQIEEITGQFTAATPDGIVGGRKVRFLAIQKGGLKLIFDLNPLGPGDYINNYQQSSVRGIWDIVREGDKLILRQQSSLPPDGGLTGAKLCIREGVFSDYDRYHALRRFHYDDHLTPENFLSFGAAKTGKQYRHADLAPYAAERQSGWTDPAGLKQTVHSPEGAYYANVSGCDAEFRITGLRDGVHIVTVGIGNYGNQANRFDLSCNQQEMAKAFSVGKQEAVTLSLPLWVRDGEVRLRFRGNFLVSVIATQFLLADAEDFSFRRALWVTDGYEPAILFRNRDWQPAGAFAVSCERFALPAPGAEMKAPLRMPERPVELPDPDNPALAWRYTANIFSLRAYTMAEWADRAELEKYMGSLKDIGVNAVMTGGLHSRHTYPAHLERGKKMIGQIVDAAHRNEIKVIEHHEATLLWNLDQGFRILCQRLPETVRSIDDNLPSFQFCIMNDQFTRTYTEYCKDLVKLGVDGLQLDELYFFRHSCVCAACRAKFQHDTGWQIPVNELDPALTDRKHPLWKAWFEWKRIKETNWLVDLRRTLKTINPNLTLTQYTTHHGFKLSLPRDNSARDLEEYARAIDFFGTEVMTRNAFASARAVIPFRKAFNLLHFAYRTPIWAIFYNNNWDVRYFCYALSNMNAQQPLLPYDRCPPGKSDYQTFAAHPDNMDRAHAEPLARIALLFSGRSRDWNSLASFEPELFGLAQTLEEMHVPYQVIGSASLKSEALGQFDIVSLGASGCLADEEVQAVKDYARAGGAVWLTTITGLFDAEGEPRKTWAFAEVFGFSPKITPLKKLTTLEDASGTRLTLQKPVNYFPLQGRFRPESALYIIFNQQRLPCWIEQPYGKGKMIYQPLELAGALYAPEVSPGKKWQFERDDALAELLHRELRRMLGDAALWQTDAPEKVYTTLYREPDRLLVHFLNATGVAIKKGEVMTDRAPEVAYPALAQDISFTVSPGFPVRQVYAVSPDFAGRKELSFAVTPGGECQVALPKAMLNVYTIVILDRRAP